MDVHRLAEVSWVASGIFGVLTGLLVFNSTFRALKKIRARTLTEMFNALPAENVRRRPNPDLIMPVDPSNVRIFRIPDEDGEQHAESRETVRASVRLLENKTTPPSRKQVHG
jgi:hypothetical protein